MVDGEQTIPLTGGCRCGKIRYSLTKPPLFVMACHCTDCQTLSGSPFRASVPAQAEDFHLLRGQPRIYIKTAASGRKRAQAFCADCGTPIYACAAKHPAQYNLRLGAVRQRARIPPLRQSWCGAALEWARNVEELPRSASE